MQPRRIAVAVAAALLPAAVHAQSETRLPEVSVRASAESEPAYKVPAATTATKTDTPLKDIPQTINVVDQQLIREVRALYMKDALRNVPGVFVSGGEGRRDQFAIRGFSAELDMYVDGIRDMASFRDLSNIERIEVLKGPAAMLFGRGSAGGVINRVTKKPTAEPIREVQATVGSDDLYRAEVDLGGALGPAASFRLTGAHETGGQFRDHIDNERTAVAGGIEFKLAPATRLLTQVELLRQEATPDRGIPSVNGRPADVPVSNFYGELFDFSEREVANLGATLDHAFSEATRLRATLRLNTMELDAINTRATGLAAGNTQVVRNTTRFPKEREYLFGQMELIHKLKLGATEHLLLAGYEHGRQEADLKVWQVAAPNISLHNPSYVAPAPNFTPASQTFNTSFTGITDGVYVQDQITFSTRWKAVAGVRYDVFDQHQENRLNGTTLEREDRKWSPRMGVMFQPAPATSWYGSLSRSFQPAADDLLFANASAANLKPTSATQVEVGNKNELLNGRLAVNFALYRIAMTDIATNDPANPGQSIQVGEQVHKGFELEAVGELTRRWRIFGGATWLDPEITKANPNGAGVTLQGKRPANTPRQAFSLWTSYDLGQGLSASLGVYRVGARYATADNTVTLPAYTRLDAGLAYKLRSLELALNVRNLTDKRYFESATQNHQIAPGTPRSVLLTARYAF